MTDPASLRRPMTIAHRYGNTLAGIRAAADAGADFVECDVWLRNGRLDVRHEHTLGPIPIWYDRWKLERAHLAPSLSDILTALPPTMGIMIDLKGTHPGMPAAVIEAVAPFVATHPIMISARSWHWLPLLHAAHPNLILFHSVGKRPYLNRLNNLLTDEPDEPASVGDRGETTNHQLRTTNDKLQTTNSRAVSIHYNLLSAETVRDLKKSVSLIATWPINDATRLNNVLAWQVGAIITDDLAVLRKVARER